MVEKTQGHDIHLAIINAYHQFPISSNLLQRQPLVNNIIIGLLLCRRTLPKLILRLPNGP